MSIFSVAVQWAGNLFSSFRGAGLEQMIGTNWTGRRVDQRQALQLSAVWACVRLISETLATLPVSMYRRQADNRRVLATDHPLYVLLHALPNASMSAVSFWEVLVASLLLWGNAYCEISRTGKRIIALNFLPPDRVTPTLDPDTGLLRYTYRFGGRSRDIAQADMMHIPAFSIDGIIGLSPVAFGANVFGGAMEADEASQKVFSSGMRASGFIMSPDTLKKDQRDAMRVNLETFKGDKGAGRTMVLEGGMDYKPLSMNPDDAELLQTRYFGIEEVCRWFRVPPFMVGHAEKSTTWGTGIESQMIGFVTFVLRPWCVRIEQGVSRSLLTPAERIEYFPEFGMEGLLRGDSAARAAFYSVMVNNGVLTRDEVRGLENWPAMGGNAAVLTVQSAMVPLDKIGMAAAPADAVQTALKQWLGHQS